MTPALQSPIWEASPCQMREQCYDRHLKKPTGLRRASGLTASGCLRPPCSLTSCAGSFPQLDNQARAHDPGPQSERSLPGPTKHLRSQLAQCRQRYQDLQEKLLISEATVFAQANQLEKYRVMFSKSGLLVTSCLSSERLHALQTSLFFPTST